jgi:hypothetical protein
MRGRSAHHPEWVSWRRRHRQVGITRRDRIGGSSPGWLRVASQHGLLVEVDATLSVRQDRLMEGFHEGQKVWVEQPDGSQRPGVFVTDAEIPGLMGGPPAAYVVYPDTRSGEEVSLLRVTPREE